MVQATALLGSVRGLQITENENDVPSGIQLSDGLIPVLESTVIMLDYIDTDEFSTKIKNIESRLSFRWDTIYKKDTKCIPLNHVCTNSFFF